MSDSGYFPLQPSLQQRTIALPGYYPNSEPYWQSFTNFGPPEQPFFPETFFDPNAALTVDQQFQVASFPQPVAFPKEEDTSAAISPTPKKARAMQVCPVLGHSITTSANGARHANRVDVVNSGAMKAFHVPFANSMG